jgi:16S rRNA (cytidine1402-2'-O)-methyltransferase
VPAPEIQYLTQYPKSSAARNAYIIDGKEFRAATLEPGLYITATPIGNLGDITLRALATLAGADLVLCEDTRISRRLMQRFSIGTSLQAYHDHNGAQMRPRILEWLGEGKSIALVSDAGMPLVSDPGFKLAALVRAHELPVHVVPGPSAPIAGLALSGLPSDRFLFAGFLPAKKQARCKVLGELGKVQATLIFFESAKRVKVTLSDIAETLGDRPVAITREITKLHEEVLCGTAHEVADQLSVLKGEITLLIGPPQELDPSYDDAEIVAALRTALASMSVGKASSFVAKSHGLSRQDLYQRALALRQKDNGDGT